MELKLTQYTSILYLFSLLVGISYESHFMLFPGLLKFSFLCIVEEGVEVHSVLQIQASVLQNKEQLSHYNGRLVARLNTSVANLNNFRKLFHAGVY